MYNFDFAAPAVAFAQWVWGIGREEIFVFLLGWVCNRLKIFTIVRLNWRGMTVPYRVLFICSMMILLVFPVLRVVRGQATAVATLDTWGTELMVALGVLGLAWIAAFVHDRKLRRHPF